MLPPDAYCREIEAHLCRKNDGHLIRIVGPAFERVMSWAEQGIPLKVALAGVDRYFERYYRKGPRRRPVRVEFCDADVLDAFDEWRRAVGVSIVTPEGPGGPSVEEPVPGTPRPRRSLRTHIDAVLARLTVLRGSDRLGPVADEALDRTIRAVEPCRTAADNARGDQRQQIIESLESADRELLEALLHGLPDAERSELEVNAERELEPFRARMAADAYGQARGKAIVRSVRQRFGLPELVP